MKLKGKIFDVATNEPLFGVNIFVSDKDGKLLTPIKGTASDPDGKYILDAINTTGYVTVSSVGYETMTYPILAPTNSITQGMNFGLKQKTNELAEFTIIEEAPKPLIVKKDNKKVYAVVGICLVSFLIGTLIYKNL